MLVVHVDGEPSTALEESNPGHVLVVRFDKSNCTAVYAVSVLVCLGAETVFADACRMLYGSCNININGAAARVESK